MIGNATSESYARVYRKWLSDPQMQQCIPVSLRLFLLIICETREGKRPVRLSGKLAAEIGVNRAQKCVALRRLKNDGLIFVEQVGRQVPTVWLLRRGPNLDEIKSSTIFSLQETVAAHDT